MLTPDYFYGKSDKLIEMYQDLEDWIIRDIAARLMKSGEVSGTTDRELWKLQQMGLHNTEIVKRISQITGKSRSEVRRLLQDSAMTSFSDDKKVLKDNAPDADALNTKINELTETLEKERKERAEKDEKDRLGGLVVDFFKDKHFVNEITANAIKEQLVSKLNSDEARGKSISDLFDGLVKGEDGKYKPDILIDDKDYEAQQRKRAALRGANIDQPGGTKLSMAELMKLKNQNPDMDITPSDVKRNENNCFVLAQLLNVSLVTYRDNLPKHPDREYFENLRKNVQALRDVGYRFIETPEVPPQPINTYQKVNDLEKILHDVYEVYNSNFTYYAGEGLCAGDDTNLLL